MWQRTLLLVLTLPLLRIGSWAAAAEPPKFAIETHDDRLVITDGGRPVAEYVFRDPVIKRPYLANVHAPDGTLVTRHHPPRPGIDLMDHDTFHPGIWIAFGSLNGEDFWRNKGAIVHESFAEPPMAKNGFVTIQALHKLHDQRGGILGELMQYVAIGKPTDDHYAIRLLCVVFSRTHDLKFGDQEEMGLGVRVASELTEKNGGVVNADGQRAGAKTIWGTRGPWCDYSRTIDGRRLGVAILPDHDQPRGYWWHTRDYGLMVANKFGKRSVTEGQPAELVVPRESVLSVGGIVLAYSTKAQGGLSIDERYRYYNTPVAVDAPIAVAVSAPKIEAISWKQSHALAAPEAKQAAAADYQYVYAITNDAVAKYDRKSGDRVAISTGEAVHLNSGFIHDGKLYCAHSNFPKKPERSEIFVLDPATMKLESFKDFGNFGGSLTWAIRRGDEWWCNFALYGDASAKTFLVRFDRDWKETGRWTYPPEVIGRIGGASLSGGIWHHDLLTVTDHDHGRLYRLRVPEEGDVLEFVCEDTAPITGQGIAVDPVTGGLIGIDRAKRQIVFFTEQE